MIDDDVIVSLNVAVTGEFTATVVALLVGETDETVGTVVSITKEVVAKVLLTFPAESVTVIVQFE